MIRHENVRVKLTTEAPQRVEQTFAVVRKIFYREESGDSVIAALNDVLWLSGKTITALAGHAENLGQRGPRAASW
jgi:hypothetical protein